MELDSLIPIPTPTQNVVHGVWILAQDWLTLGPKNRKLPSHNPSVRQLDWNNGLAKTGAAYNSSSSPVNLHTYNDKLLSFILPQIADS